MRTGDQRILLEPGDGHVTVEADFERVDLESQQPVVLQRLALAGSGSQRSASRTVWTAPIGRSDGS